MIYIKRILFLIAALPLGIMLALWLVLEIALTPPKMLVSYILYGEANKEKTLLDFIPRTVISVFGFLKPDLEEEKLWEK